MSEEEAFLINMIGLYISTTSNSPILELKSIHSPVQYYGTNTKTVLVRR